MFIKNSDSINPNKVIWVGDKTRLFLQSKGFCECSISNKKWGFIKTDEIAKNIDTYIKNGGEICE